MVGRVVQIRAATRDVLHEGGGSEGGGGGVGRDPPPPRVPLWSPPKAGQKILLPSARYLQERLKVSQSISRQGSSQSGSQSGKQVPLWSPPKAGQKNLSLNPRSKILAVSLKHWKGRKGELGLGTLNPCFVVWPLELGFGSRNPRFVVWLLELGLGTCNPRFVVWLLGGPRGTPPSSYGLRPF